MRFTCRIKKKSCFHSDKNFLSLKTRNFRPFRSTCNDNSLKCEFMSFADPNKMTKNETKICKLKCDHKNKLNFDKK